MTFRFTLNTLIICIIYIVGKTGCYTRALRVATKTHKIVCVLANWTKDVHAPGLAVDKPVFYDPTVFESEPSSDYGDSTP